jgi:hypothetical protein
MSNDGYTKLNIARGKGEETDSDLEFSSLNLDKDNDDDSFEVNLPNEQEDEVDEKENIDKTDADTDTKSTKKNNDKKKTKKHQPKSQNSSHKRIKQLLQDNEALRNKLEELENQTKQTSLKAKKESRSSKESMRDTLSSQLDNLKKQLRNAIEEGNSGDVVDLQTSLHDTQIKLAALTYELQEDFEDEDDIVQSHKEEKKDVNKNRVDNTENTVSQKALDWVEEHEAFKTDPVFYGAAITMNNVLLNEGYDPDSDDFYEELNERLAPRFPDIFDEEFDTDDENSVKYNRNDTSDDYDDDEDDDGTENNNNRKTSVKNNHSKTRTSSKKPQQTMSGASRGSGGRKNLNKKNVVNLSQEDVALIKKWGLDPVRFAKRKQKAGKTDKNSGEYTPINIG